MFGSKTAPESDGAPRSVFDKLLATTPVVMTVVATILAGLSNSEMIKAQYHRALAAQNQSKVGDQWAFFQFKRARGTSQDLTAKLLAALTHGADLDADALRNQADRLVRGLRSGSAIADQLIARVKAAQAALGASYAPVLQAAERLRTDGQDKVARAERWKEALNAALSEQDTITALAALTGAAPPKAAEQAPATDDPTIRQLLQDIAERKTEEDTVNLMPDIQEKHVREAIRAVETRAQAADLAGKPVAKALDRLDRLLTDETALTRSWERNVTGLRTALDDVPNRDAAGVKELLTSAAPLASQAVSLRQAAQETSTAFISSRLRFDERRYQREADDNRLSAGLYEIQVRKSSWHSERHRLRSGYFFYGMLAAQAGVTIASLALAVRMKSLLWSMASLAGTVAIIIGAYVYLYV